MHTSGTARASWWEWLGAAGFWPACYTAAAGAAVSHAAGAEVGGPGLAATTLGAQGVYLLDRVRWRDRWMDPADAAGDPVRFAPLTRCPGRWRVVAVCLLIVATLTLMRTRPAAAWAPAGFATLGLLYAGGPARSRGLRSAPGLKPLLVGLGVTAYCGWALLGSSLLSAWAPAVLVALVVAADTALCDLDDLDSDARTGAGSLSRWIPHGWVVAFAAFVQLAAAVAAWALGVRAGVVIGLAALAATTPIALARNEGQSSDCAASKRGRGPRARLAGVRIGPRRVKDLVDLRGPAVAIGVALWLALAGAAGSGPAG